MTESEANVLILEFLKDYCSYPNARWKEGETPAGITLAIDKIWQFAIKGDLSKQSESLADWSTVYSHATNWENWPSPIRKMVNTYRGMNWS